MTLSRQRPLPSHGDADFGVLEHLGEGIAGELAPLVGVEDLGFAVTSQGVFERGHAEIGIQCIGQPPGQKLAARPVQDCHQVEEAAPQRNIAD